MTNRQKEDIVAYIPIGLILALGGGALVITLVNGAIQLWGAVCG